MTTITTTKDAIAAARTRMEKAVDDFRKETTSLRTGRANAMLLDNVRVDYHGTPMPVNQLGTVTVPDVPGGGTGGARRLVGPVAIRRVRDL